LFKFLAKKRQINYQQTIYEQIDTML